MQKPPSGTGFGLAFGIALERVESQLRAADDDGAIAAQRLDTDARGLEARLCGRIFCSTSDVARRSYDGTWGLGGT